MVLVVTKDKANERSSWCAMEVHFVSLRTQKVVGSADVISKSVCTILKSSQLVHDGHIYYANSLLKLRYDLLGQAEDDKLFEIYTNLLELESGEASHSQIAVGFPIYCEQKDLMLYVTKNMRLMQPKKAIFLPLFHQREFNILERQNEIGDDCFVAQFHDVPGNTLDQKYMSLNLSKSHYSVLSMSGFREKLFDFNAEVEKYG